ncbi:hypothetical protein T06_15568 [Trichinella sp. T6]|nr:hypothetical protein T06_15568 [Trichinella sp. T6]
MKAKTVVHKVEVQRAKFHGMVDQLIQLCENASHTANIRKPLEEVMAFRDTALELEPRSDSCSAISKDLNLRSSSKPEASVHRQKYLDDSLKFVNLLSSLSGEPDEENHAEFWRELSTRRRVVEDTFWTYGCHSSETRESTLGCKLCTDSGNGEMTVSEAFLPLLAERFPEILALRATSMCSQGQALRTTSAAISSGRRIVKQYEMRQKEAGPGAKSCTEPTREGKSTATVSITVRHLAIISNCPFCKDARDAANCTELRKTDVQTPSMAEKTERMNMECVHSPADGLECPSRSGASHVTAQRPPYHWGSPCRIIFSRELKLTVGLIYGVPHGAQEKTKGCSDKRYGGMNMRTDMCTNRATRVAAVTHENEGTVSSGRALHDQGSRVADAGQGVAVTVEQDEDEE